MVKALKALFAIGAAALFATMPTIGSAQEAEGRRIEEVVVTAERRESTVSDTSISITAFTGEFIEDFGIRNQEDLQNLVPAAVIEPYDMAIRGVGRNFRSLGGDPGIATYLNGVYSEDFGIASTEGGLFDIERIEFLRGPQGTLYGRNAIGGAVNFINKKPSEEFEGEMRVVAGSFALKELYGVISGPLIENLLQGRVTGVKRTRDGYYDDLSGAPDPGNYGDENYALSLRFTPTDNIEVNLRANERSYARRMAGADAAGIINISENGGSTRDTSTYAIGYRAVDPGNVCPDMFTRTAPVPTTGVIGGTGCAVAGVPMSNFINPTTGDTVSAQRITSGVDKQTLGTTDSPNYAYGADVSRQRLIGLDDIEGDDLDTDTNGQQDEYFDQQAVSMDVMWDINDKFGMKYIFGYTDYFYDRSSDTDLTSSRTMDRTFYVIQETEYVSHELQFFIDPSEDLSITAGLFYYDAKISQRGDFYDHNCFRDRPCGSRYRNDDPTGTAAFLPGKVDLFTARGAANNLSAGNALPGNCFTGDAIGAGDQLDVYCFGAWSGDDGDRVMHGPQTHGTDLEYTTRTERYAFAAFGQAVYTFNEKWALTSGLRWARDQLNGYETVFYYSEADIVPLGFGAGGNGCDVGTTCTSDLAATNIALGYLDDTTGEILDPNRLLVGGIPASNSLFRQLSKATEDVTWRLNLDYTPTEDDLIYLSATKGLRSGGFNLVFFSSNSVFDPEELIAYELGYKGTMLDGQLQLNAAVYFYDYENVHTFANGLAFSGGYTTNVIAVPEAEMKGFDADITWLATDNLTIGAHVSYTGTEYTSDQLVIDPNNPLRPASLFNAADNFINIKGNQMLRVPEKKGGGWAMYSYQLGDNGRLEFLANYSWIDRVYFSVFEQKDQSAPSYDRFDLRATWHNAEESVMVAAFVNNVFNDIGWRQIEQYGSTEESLYRRTGAPTDPRLAGLEVRYKF
ncbi:MAG: TonB-dependent receptor plug domain-containing protein [Pseudomonadales bacterium]|nr:TonB-dependent receptor plug domain-containing protein [Pseudomonadales bacterium]